MIKLNHVAIAVSDLPKLKKLISLLGLSIQHSENVPEQGVMTHFVELPETQVAIELLEPIDPKGAVSRFIQKRGPGIHHLSFAVPKGKLESICHKLTENGFQLTYPTPKSGAHGMKINFIHPSSCDGVLIELMENA